MRKLLLFLMCSFYVTIETHSEECPIVHLPQGSLRGKFMISRDGRRFHGFLQIPFAAPPLGSLRFMPPEPPPKWNGVRDATKQGRECTQLRHNGNEDCLFLNVFTHGAKHNKSSPVMVFIHGGGFYGGSASLDLYGPEYLMDKNIVLVTIQYRLGIFGFLSNEDKVIPGNMGLKDQRRALQWVQENIDIFGGDPSAVTIFGNSAGSASVHFHMISSKSKHLFKRAISQSGTALSAFALIGKGTSTNLTLWFAQSLQCPTNSSTEILNCLQSKSSEVIQQEYNRFQRNGYDMRSLLFRPVIEIPSEHAFLTEDPLNTTTDKAWMIGLMKNEGLWKVHLPSFNKTKHIIKYEYRKFLPYVLFFDDTSSNPSDVAEKIYDFYFKHISTDDEMITSLEQVISDSYFVWPMIQALQQHNGATYCYFFEHNGEHSVTEHWQAPQGISHMDELHYLFPQKRFFPLKKNNRDTNISKLLVDLWVNFASSGNPTPQPINSNPNNNGTEKIIWEPSVNNDMKFFSIQTEKLSMVRNIFQERIHFWKNLPIRDKIYLT